MVGFQLDSKLDSMLFGCKIRLVLAQLTLWLSGHGGHHDPSEAVHGRSAGSGGRRQEERDGGCCFQNCEEVFAEKILIKMTIPGGAEGSGAEAILL